MSECTNSWIPLGGILLAGSEVYKYSLLNLHFNARVYQKRFLKNVKLKKLLIVKLDHKPCPDLFETLLSNPE